MDSEGLGERFMAVVLVDALWVRGPVVFVGITGSGFALAVSLGACAAPLHSVLYVCTVMCFRFVLYLQRRV